MNKTVAAPEQASIAKLRAGGLHQLGHRPGDRPIVRIHLLGPMRATTYLGDNILPHGKRARAVLGYLCLAAGEPVPSARLAALLWDRLDDAAAQTNLRQALRELTSAFGAFAKELISTGQDTVRLNVDACWIDALAALTLDPLALDSPHGDLQALCGGDLLEDLDGASASFDRWLLDERTRVTEHLQSLLERELDHAEPKSSASRRLKRALADMREQAEALRNFARHREARQTALKAEPLLHDSVPLKAEQASDNGENRGRNAAGSAMLRAPRAKPAPASGRDRLRVGVLPFLSSGSEKEDNLAFSLSQEIAAALARFRWFDVIAPTSLRPMASTRFFDEHQLIRMDLDYVVDGTISGTGKYLQISVRLMDLAEYARPVWGECFNLARGELHRLNELVTTRIVGRIDPVILFIEGQPKRREHYGATGLLLLAIPLIFSMERRKYEQAGQLISQALEIEPDNSMAAAWAAHWHLFYVGQGWAQDTKQVLATVQKYALRAVKLDPDNAEALGIYAHCCAYGDKDFDTAIHYFDRSLRLNPSLAFIWAYSALTYCYIGKPELALQRLERYRELAPSDPYFSLFENVFTIAYTFKGDYERAALVGRRVVRANPDFAAGYKPLIASLGHLGRRDEAQPYIAKLLTLEPNFTIEQFGQAYPIKKASDRRHYMRGLRLAGVPER
jgi:DNA-binding SARP family transcriptional activator/TolB-like protein/Tfp pilus assembly protein PilF